MHSTRINLALGLKSRTEKQGGGNGQGGTPPPFYSPCALYTHHVLAFIFFPFQNLMENFTSIFLGPRRISFLGPLVFISPRGHNKNITFENIWLAIYIFLTLYFFSPYLPWGSWALGTLQPLGPWALGAQILYRYSDRNKSPLKVGPREGYLGRTFLDGSVVWV